MKQRLSFFAVPALLGLYAAALLLGGCASPNDPQERYDGEWYGHFETDNRLYFRIAYDRVQRVSIDGGEEPILFPLGNAVTDSRFRVYLREREIWLEGHFTDINKAEGTLHAYGQVYSWSAIKAKTKNGRLLVEESYFWEPHIVHLAGRSRGKLVLEKIDLTQMVKHHYQLYFTLENNQLKVSVGDLDRGLWLFYEVAFQDSMHLDFDGIRLTLINDPQSPFGPDDVYEFWYE